MPSLFAKGLETRFTELIDVGNAQIVSAVEKVGEVPGVGQLVRRTAERAVERFAAEELGVAPPLRFPDEYAFFDDYLRPAYETGGMSQDQGWCERWWAHQSVVLRVRAMWRSYEHRAQTAPATCDEEFLRLVGDYHMRFLMGRESPMLQCSPRNHKASEPLKSAPLDMPKTKED